MTVRILSSTALAAWAAATSQQVQLEGLRDEWAGQMSVRYYSAADAHLATVTHATPIIDTTTTPYSLRLGAWVAESHVQDGTAAYCILAVPAGADILRCDVSLAGAISDPGGRVRLDIGTTLRVYATASLPPPNPTWVPSTAWEWAEIAGTTWDDYIKDDGSGIAPALDGTEPSAQKTYSALWDFSAPCYSRANHEVWFQGGGHAASTINLVTRWNLGQDSPDIDIADAATAKADRVTRLASGAFYDEPYFPTDGRPYSTHSYQNLVYSDAAGEFFIFGFGFMASGSDGSGSGWDDFSIAGLPRGGSWRAAGYYTAIPISQSSGPRFLSEDGTTVFYWQASSGATSTSMRKWVISTDTHSTVGSSAVNWYSRQADDGAGRALVLGSEDTGGAWLAQYVDLSDGTTSSVTVSGDSLPSGRGIYGLQWCDDKGYWLAVFFNSAALYAEPSAAISAITVATITPTGSSTATASVRTMTGTGPGTCGAYRGVFYDPAYSTALVVSNHNEPIHCFKVA